MKIYITGGPGSGKTFVSNTIAKRCNIGKLSLDEIVWDKYYKEKTTRERDETLHNFLCNNKSWIIEGTYFDWLLDLFTKSDLIIFIQTNVMLRSFRILKRFLKNKISKNGKESIKSLFHMLLWNYRYEKNVKKEFVLFTKGFSFKIINVKDKDKIEYIENLETILGVLNRANNTHINPVNPDA